MIDIPEERILKEITDILMNDLPQVLLELEEQSQDSIRLPPFRYVGLEENLPTGTSLPYAFVEIEEGEYTEKDRIIKSCIFVIRVSLNLQKELSICAYYRAILDIFKTNKQINNICWKMKKKEVRILLRQST